MKTKRQFVMTAMLAFASLMSAQPPQPPAPPAPPSTPVPPSFLDSLDDVLSRVRELDLGALRDLPDIPPLPPLPPLAALDRVGPILESLPLFAMQTGGQERDRDERQRARDLARASRDREDRDYHAGSSYLDRHEYEKAAEAFNRVIEQKGSRSDGALYWRAYAQNKLGQREEALASLAELEKSYPNSHWLEDAKALEVEVRQKSGQPVSPENASDEDLKLLAINSLMNSDPERSMPLLEKLLKSGNSPKLKERALFVLAQSHTQQARDLLSQVARGASNPDLQLKAVEYLGIFGGKENLQTLSDIYKGSNELAVKRAILRSFMVSGSQDQLLAAAKTESSPDLKIEAIRQLGNIGGAADLAQLYPNESSAQVKRVIIQALFVSGNSDKLFELAKGEKDAALRQEAIRQLGLMGRTKTAPFLVQLYGQETDAGVKKTVLEALFIQGNAPALVELARKESDPEMKKRIVQNLSLMHSKEATDYLMELLNK